MNATWVTKIAIENSTLSHSEKGFRVPGTLRGIFRYMVFPIDSAI